MRRLLFVLGLGFACAIIAPSRAFSAYRLFAPDGGTPRPSEAIISRPWAAVPMTATGEPLVLSEVAETIYRSATKLVNADPESRATAVQEAEFRQRQSDRLDTAARSFLQKTVSGRVTIVDVIEPKPADNRKTARGEVTPIVQLPGKVAAICQVSGGGELTNDHKRKIAKIRSDSKLAAQRLRAKKKSRDSYEATKIEREAAKEIAAIEKDAASQRFEVTLYLFGNDSDLRSWSKGDRQNVSLALQTVAIFRGSDDDYYERQQGSARNPDVEIVARIVTPDGQEPSIPPSAPTRAVTTSAPATKPTTVQQSTSVAKSATQRKTSPKGKTDLFEE